MNSATFEISDLESVCKLAKEFGIRRFKVEGIEIDFFGSEAEPADIHPQHRTPGGKEPTDDELLMNPMAGVENG